MKIFFYRLRDNFYAWDNGPRWLIGSIIVCVILMAACNFQKDRHIANLERQIKTFQALQQK